MRAFSIGVLSAVLGCSSAGSLDEEPADVRAGDVQAGQVLAGDVQAGPVSAGAVTAGDVSAGEVLAGTVEAGPVAAGDVAAGDVQAGPVLAGDVQAGAVTAGDVAIAELSVENGGLAIPLGSVQILYGDSCATPPGAAGAACPAGLLDGPGLSAAWTAQVQGACTGGTLRAFQALHQGVSAPLYFVAVLDCP